MKSRLLSKQVNRSKCVFTLYEGHKAKKKLPIPFIANKKNK